MPQSPTPVSLRLIVAELDARPNESTTFLDLETGTCQWFYDAVLGAAEDGREPPSDVYSEPEDLEAAASVLADTNRFRRLPSAFDIHEYDIMFQFIEQLDDDRLARQLASAIRGAGAFRRFKDAISRAGIEQRWYHFRERALADIARDWLETEEIRFVEDLETRT